MPDAAAKTGNEAGKTVEPGGEPPGKVAVSRAEALIVFVLVAVGLGIWVLVDRHVTSYTKGWEPREERAQLDHNAPWLQAQLAMTLDERKATQDQLIQARLEVARQQAALDALSATTPAPASTPAATPASTPAPTDPPRTTTPSPQQARADAHVKRETAARLVNELIARLDLLQREANRLGGEHERGRWLAAREFGRAQAGYRVKKALLTLGLCLLLMGSLLVLVAEVFRYRVAQKRTMLGVRADGVLLWWTVAGALLILFGYQTFEMAGAAIAGFVVLLVLLARGPWKPRREGAAEGQ